MLFKTWHLAALIGLVSPSAGCGQVPEPLDVGATAPDFALAAATRSGVLAEPVRLSDFRGKTVVLAFFYRVRTPG